MYNIFWVFRGLVLPVAMIEQFHFLIKNFKNVSRENIFILEAV